MSERGGCGNRIVILAAEMASRKDFRAKMSRLGEGKDFFLSQSNEQQILKPDSPFGDKDKLVTSEAKRIVSSLRNEFGQNENVLKFINGAYATHLKEAEFGKEKDRGRNVAVIEILNRAYEVYQLQVEYGFQGTAYKSLWNLYTEFQDIKQGENDWNEKLNEKLESIVYVVKQGTDDGTVGGRQYKDFIEIENWDNFHYYFNFKDCEPKFEIGTKQKKGKYKKIGDVDSKILFALSETIISECAEEVMGKSIIDIDKFLRRCKELGIEEDVKKTSQ